MASLNKVLVFSLLLLTLFVILSSLAAADAWDDIQSKIKTIICGLKIVFARSATGVAAFVMIIAGVQWISSENDPGARKKAKTTMVHAIVGLLIVTIADNIASLVITFSCT